MRPARGSYPCGRVGCGYIAISPGQLGGHRTTHSSPCVSAEHDPSAHSLYVQAEGEHPGDRLAIRARYNALLRDHGLIVCATCGLSRDDPEALSCSSGFHRKEADRG